MKCLFLPKDAYVYSFQVHIYLNSKCQRSADMRRNPRRVTWTVYYRRKHKKGAAEQEVKKRTRRNVKFQRAITGVTWNEILAKRNQQPEFRKAQRQDAIKYESLIICFIISHK